MTTRRDAEFARRAALWRERWAGFRALVRRRAAASQPGQAAALAGQRGHPAAAPRGGRAQRAAHRPVGPFGRLPHAGASGSPRHPTSAAMHRLWRSAFGLYSARHLTIDADTLAAAPRSPCPPTTPWAEAPPLEISPRLRRTGSYERRGKPTRVADRSAERRHLAELAAARGRGARPQPGRRWPLPAPSGSPTSARSTRSRSGCSSALLGDALAALAPGYGTVSTTTSDGIDGGAAHRARPTQRDVAEIPPRTACSAGPTTSWRSSTSRRNAAEADSMTSALDAVTAPSRAADRAHEGRAGAAAPPAAARLTAGTPSSFVLVRRHASELREWFDRNTGLAARRRQRGGPAGQDRARHRRRHAPGPRRRAAGPPFTRRRYVLGLPCARRARTGRRADHARAAGRAGRARRSRPGPRRGRRHVHAGAARGAHRPGRGGPAAAELGVLAPGRRRRGRLRQRHDGDALYDVDRRVLAALLASPRGPSTVAATSLEERLAALTEELPPNTDELRNRGSATA